MIGLNELLETQPNNPEKKDFMLELFCTLQEEVNKVIEFGPCNSDDANSAATVYCFNRQRLFPVAYHSNEKAALPAAIANIDRLAKSDFGTPFSSILDPNTLLKSFESLLLSTYLFGTGTCECFAIVGAVILAQKFEVNLSIETIVSTESHTYLRLHTKPEFIMDFWTPMACEYNNAIEWNETVGLSYIRTHTSQFKTDIKLNSVQLREMGERVFTKENAEKRQENMDKVKEACSRELTSPQSSQLTHTS